MTSLLILAGGTRATLHLKHDFTFAAGKDRLRRPPGRFRIRILVPLRQSGPEDSRGQARLRFLAPTHRKAGMGLRLGGDATSESDSRAAPARRRTRIRVLGFLCICADHTESLRERRRIPRPIT